jgi:hypothetical protein
MSAGITGTYEGEGPNVAGALKVTLPVDVAAQGTSTTTGQGRTASVKVTRRQQLRVSSEGGRSSAAINVGGGDQVLTNCARGVYIGTAGNLVGRLVEDTADQTWSNLAAGTIYPLQLALVRQTGTTAAGNLLF